MSLWLPSQVDAPNDVVTQAPAKTVGLIEKETPA
jgi:hypothetical protein